MADYPAARSAIATIIDAVTITSPVAASIVKVYERRPDAGTGLSEFPCVLITGATIDVDRSSGLRERTYTVGLRLVVRPIAGAPMQDLLDAFKEGIISAFDAKQALGGGVEGCMVVSGPNWTNKEPFVDGGAQWEEGDLVIRIEDAPTLGG